MEVTSSPVVREAAPRYLRWAWLAFAALLLAFAVGIAVVSTFSYDTLRSWALPYLHKPELFTPGVYKALLQGLRALAAASGVLSVLVSVNSARLSKFSADAWRHLHALLSDSPRLWGSFLDMPKAHAAALAAVALGALALRLRYLFGPIRTDEAYTATRYSTALFKAIAFYFPNNHPLNSVLIFAAGRVAGMDPWVVRLPAFLAGLAIVALTYIVCRMLYGSDAALLAGAMASASLPLIEFSVNGRGYSLGTMFLLGMLLFVLLAFRGYKAGWWLAGVCAALALYSVPTMLYGIAGVIAWAAFASRRWRDVLAMIVVAGVLAATLYAPMLATSRAAGAGDSTWLAPLPLGATVRLLPTAGAALMAFWTSRVPVALLPLLLGGLVVGLIVTRKAPLLLALIVAGVGLCLAQRVDPPRRVWLFILPVVLMTTAAGFASLIQRARATRLAVPVMAIALAAVMGWTVLAGGDLYWTKELYSVHTRWNSEEEGLPNARAIVERVRPLLEAGASVYAPADVLAPLEYEMHRLRISSNTPPDTASKLVVVTRPTVPVSDPLAWPGWRGGLAGAHVVRVIATTPFANVYEAERSGRGAAITP